MYKSCTVSIRDSTNLLSLRFYMMSNGSIPVAGIYVNGEKHWISNVSLFLCMKSLFVVKNTL